MVQRKSLLPNASTQLNPILDDGSDSTELKSRKYNQRVSGEVVRNKKGSTLKRAYRLKGGKVSIMIIISLSLSL